MKVSTVEVERGPELGAVSAVSDCYGRGRRGVKVSASLVFISL